jgi:hypothetical protein
MGTSVMTPARARSALAARLTMAPRELGPGSATAHGRGRARPRRRVQRPRHGLDSTLVHAAPRAYWRRASTSSCRSRGRLLSRSSPTPSSPPSRPEPAMASIFFFFSRKGRGFQRRRPGQASHFHPHTDYVPTCHAAMACHMHKYDKNESQST